MKDFKDMSTLELYKALKNPMYNAEAKQRIQILIARRYEQHQVAQTTKDKTVKKLAKKSIRRSRQRNFFHGTDERAVKNSAKNTVGVGSVTPIVLFGKELLSVYDNLKGRGLAPDEATIFKALGKVQLTDFELTVIITVCILTFIATMGYKILKHWEGS